MIIKNALERPSLVIINWLIFKGIKQTSVIEINSSKEKQKICLHYHFLPISFLYIVFKGKEMFYSTHLEKFYASQSRSKKKEQPTSNLNIMIVGKCGAGKTTFVRSLCRRLEGVILQGTLKVSKPWMLDNARPTDEVYHVSMHLENKLAGGGCIALTIIDTPGFVQDPTIMDHQVQYFSKYIDHQFAKTLNEASA